MSVVASTLDLRIWLLAFGTFAIGTDVFVVPGILPNIAYDLDISLDAAGQVVSVYALTYALGSPVLAAATARMPRDRLVFCALLGFAAANILCALSSTYIALLAARVAAGVAAALYTPTAYALATAAAPVGRKGAALSAVALGLTTAFVAGVPFGVVVGKIFGWHATFWFVATLSIVAAVALAWGRPRLLRSRRSPNPACLPAWHRLVAGVFCLYWDRVCCGPPRRPPSTPTWRRFWDTMGTVREQLPACCPFSALEHLPGVSLVDG